MIDFQPDIKEILCGVDSNTIDLLRRSDQLRPLTMRLLVEEITKNLTVPSDLLQQALATHCRREELNNEEALERWLEEHCISRDELLLQVGLPIRLSKLAIDSYGIKAEARFLQRKEELDQATYNLLRVKDSGLAHELYLQLEAGEANFEHLASQYSEGPEQRSGGRVGPAPLVRAHPQLRQRLLTATPGVVLEPVLIEKWWVVSRLEERLDATFDDAMRQRMATELLQQWMNEETNEVVKAVLFRNNAEGLT